MAAPHTLSRPVDDDALGELKREARRRARATLGRVDRGPASAAIAARLAVFVAASGASSVALFWPLPDEPDLRDLATTFDAEGVAVLLPRIVAPATALAFDRWRPARGLRAGPLGTRIADAAPGERDLAPELLVVPMLAFDAACRRLGRGGGFYDRTLAARPGAPAIGAAFAATGHARIPEGPDDRRLDAIATERRLHRGGARTGG